VSRAIALLVLMLQFTLCGAQELGRLFFSPAERAALDARRSEKPGDAPAAAQAPLRIDGYMLRPGGRPTVWVNGGALAAGAQAEGIRVAPRIGHPGEVTITIGANRPSVGAKVGSTLDREKVRDLIGDGQLRVQR